MKNLFDPCIAYALLFLIFTSGCGGGADSVEKLIDDRLDLIDEIAAILDGVADGDDPEDAASELLKLKPRSLALDERESQLEAAAPEEFMEAQIDQIERIMTGMGKMTDALQRVEDSGVAADQLKDALKDMQSKR